MNEKETYGFDDDYETKHDFHLTDNSESLTRSLYDYLKDRGYEVYKMAGPVALFEGESVAAKTFKYSSVLPMSQTFQSIENELIKDGATKVFIYMAIQRYSWSQDINTETMEPEGGKYLRELRMVRLDWR